jgi:DNA (cytosine-5)-methyltransferase 1
MKYLSICSGIEAASVAWHPLGWTPIGFSEIEPFPSAVLAHHYPKITNYGDMTKYEQWNIKSGTVDLLVGGTPCQSFSVAGLRQGLKDPRGNLMLTFLAIAERIKPKWIVWENVPGVLSSNGGKDFGSFLGGLGELGYGFAYRVLDAQWVRTQRHPRAVPQRRRRVFVVACAGDHISPAKVLFESESMLRYSAKSKATRQGIAEDVAGCIRSGGDGGVPSSRGEHLVFDESKPVYCGSDTNASDTVTSKWQKQSGGPAGSECGLFVLQPFDQQRIGVYGTGEVGSAVVARGHKSATDVVILPFTKSKRAQSSTDDEGWVEGVVAPTQNAFDVGDVRATTAILFENHPNDSRVTGPHDVAPSIVSRYGTGGGNVPLVIPIQDSRVIEKNQNGIGVGNENSPAYTIDQTGAQAVAIQGTVIGRQDHNGPQGSGCSDGGEMFTLNSTDVHAVAVVGQVDWRTTNNDSGQVSQTLKTDLAHQSGPCLAVAPTMQVRRLTPTECERLQGFPDGWTAIPWKKKSADDCPDGPRYKALGNSMAVNCMEWIGERIATVNATMDRP